MDSRIVELTAKAGKGDGASQLKLALLYDEMKQPEKALKWYRKAAEKGYQEAQTELGILYFTGGLVPVDKAEAAKWFRKAALFGHPTAQFNLAACYAGGSGVKKNLAVAAQWYRSAADLGCINAQYMLGVLYGRGEGVPQDYVQSYEWVSIAAAKGLQEARQSLEILQQLMTPAQISKARKHLDAASQKASTNK